MIRSSGHCKRPPRSGPRLGYDAAFIAAQPAMPPSWSDIRANAQRFARDWAEATSERAEAQTFWNEFFAVFGSGAAAGIPGFPPARE